MSAPAGPLGYGSIELGQPGRKACPDAFQSYSELRCGGARSLRVQISVAAVYVQFGVGLGGVNWGPEEPLMPSVGSLVRRFDAVRVRNYTAGQAAQVLATPVP